MGEAVRRRRALRVLGASGAAALALPPARLMALATRVRSGLVPGESRALVALTPQQARTTVALAEVIIPETDTPGATEAGVVDFIDVLLAEWLDDGERDRFLEGVADVDRRARALEGVSLEECSPEGRIALTAVLDGEVDDLRRRGADVVSHYFHDFKRFAMAGYFTSEVGMRAMGYRVVPGAWESCVLLDEYGAGTGR